MRKVMFLGEGSACFAFSLFEPSPSHTSTRVRLGVSRSPEGAVRRTRTILEFAWPADYLRCEHGRAGLSFEGGESGSPCLWWIWGSRSLHSTKSKLNRLWFAQLSHNLNWILMFSLRAYEQCAGECSLIIMAFHPDIQPKREEVLLVMKPSWFRVVDYLSAWQEKKTGLEAVEGPSNYIIWYIIFPVT